MKAVVMHEFGGPEVLKYEHRHARIGPAEACPGRGSCAVNRTLDLVVRDKYVRQPPLPHIDQGSIVLPFSVLGRSHLGYPGSISAGTLWSRRGAPARLTGGMSNESRGDA